MHKIIISDTSCLIVLAKINELDLLQKVYGKIFTTIEIADEFGMPLPGWVELKKVENSYSQLLLEIQLDKGEASALALAFEMHDSTVRAVGFKASR